MNPHPYHIAVELIEAIGEYLDSQGFDSAAFFQSQGFALDGDEHEGYVDFQVFSRLFDAAEQFTGDRCIGLSVGANFLARHWGRLGYLIMAGENGLEGVQFIQRFARIVTNALELHWQWDATTLNCDFNILAPDVSRHVYDYFVSSSLSLARVTNDGRGPYLAVHFQHDGGGCAEQYAQQLGCECHFNAPWNRIVVEIARLSQESRLRDPRLKKILEEHALQVLQKLATGDEVIGRVRQHILQQLPNGVPTLKDTCALLGQNERTFQRTLARLGFNYQDMVDELRMNLALEYLRNDYNFLDIAMMLGYSEQSAFHRAFKRWTGLPPSQYKKTLS
ncbi:MAG TPA: AraC family transcriptional regulator ligand-binding domain-containing protein [Dongiaceae bacterium]|nr:AraC family transcriptional regulator ligand-binding domain-containing protein [Dongiaceae bacterium]